MSVFDSVLVALFCMAVVFAVLVVLWVLIRLFSGIIMAFEKLTNSKDY